MRAVPVEPAVPAVHHGPTHRHTSHEHEHEFEAAPGLPEPLPSDEHLLWQGAPDWRMLARECFHVRKLAVYFSILVAWRIGTAVHAGDGASNVLIAGAMASALALTALGLATLLAWLSARTTLYTITDRRVVMRVGIVLSVTFNLPFRQIDAAGLHVLPKDHGDIALTLPVANRIAYLHLWPHVRPWRVARTQPTLRCVPDAKTVASVLTAAWRQQRGEVASTVARPVTALRPLASPSRAATTIDAAQAA